MAPANRPATPAPQNAALAPDLGRLPAERRYLPASINEPLMSMTIQVLQERPEACIYRSRHFEFKTPVKLGTGAMKEICRAFESTHELVSKLPWGITPHPEVGPFFRAELYKTRNDYLATGAQKWSAANYSMAEHIFRIPFEEVGVASRGDSYYLSGVINNDTITHEVTHQMMHEYLRFMPMWMAEGLAEYTAHLPYASGRYDVGKALESFKQMRRDFGKEKRNGLFVQHAMQRKWVGADNLWGYTTSMTDRREITNLAFDPPKPPANGFEGRVTVPQMVIDLGADMPDRYFSSHALVFYFMHLDGDGSGLRLKKYFDAIHEERKLWVSFVDEVEAYKTAFAKYLAELETFKKQRGVEDLGGGRIRYPSNLVLPPEPKPLVAPGGIDPAKVCAKHLGILLDGRSLADLDREVRAAFGKAGSPL